MLEKAEILDDYDRMYFFGNVQFNNKNNIE